MAVMILNKRMQIQRSTYLNKDILVQEYPSLIRWINLQWTKLNFYDRRKSYKKPWW
jgi:hypothetical protein